MPIRLKINILFFCLYLEGLGKYFLNQLFLYENTNSIISLIIDLLFLVLALSFLKLKSKYFNYILIFVVISTITLISSIDTSILIHLHGLREIFFFLNCFIIIDGIYRTSYFIDVNNYFKTFSLIYLCTQIPISILQFLEFGPGDYVGGTIGKGGSGIMTFSIFILVYYLSDINFKGKTLTDRLRKFLPYLIFFIPVALNETKVTFLLIGIFFLSFINFKKVTSSISAIIVGSLAVVVFSSLYSTQEKTNFSNPLEGIYSSDFLNSYLLGEGEQYEDVPRITKISIGSTVLYKNGKLLFGESYSVFKSVNSSKTQFGKKYEWLLIGSRPYFFYLFLSGGIALILLILYIVYSEFWTKKLNKDNLKSKSLLFFLFSVFTILLFYNDGLRFQIFCFFFVFILFYAKRYKFQLNSINK